MRSLNLWLREHHEPVQQWLRDLEQGLTMPLYCSVDIRDAGFKAAVVDANAFPAGWNNLPPHALELAAEALSEYFSRHFPGTQRIGIVPENHTRNKYYFDNLTALAQIVRRAGFEVAITHCNPELTHESTSVEGTHDNQLQLLQLKRSGTRVTASSFDPDVLLLNHDLAGGVPPLLDGIEQPLIPPTSIGWFQRRKSRHFDHTNRLLEQFGELFSIDPWLLGTLFVVERAVDFRARVGLDRIALHTDEIGAGMKKKYAKFDIQHACSTCVFIKDNSGTYGQAVIHVSSGEEVLSINRKMINQMDVGKGSIKVDEVLIQECVPTKFSTEQWVGEPVLYMMGDTIVGGFARMNTNERGHGNLNAPGAYFTSLESLGELNMNVYEFLVRIARIALAYEMAELNQ